MKISIISFSLLMILLQGCVDLKSKKDSKNGFEEICLNNVVYYKQQIGTHGFMSPKFDIDSKVVTCKMDN